MVVVAVLVLVYWRYRERIGLKRRLKGVGHKAKGLVGRVTRRPTP
jgi:hypothetical protein